MCLPPRVSAADRPVVAQAERPRPARPVDRRTAAQQWALGVLAVATLAAFAGVLGNGWILLDDPRYVYENPHVHRGLTLDGVRWSLTQPHGGNWHPLTSWSHMLDVQVLGLSPAGHHATSLLLHVLNALLLAIVLHRLTGAWWRSALVAGFFALHPLRVESVAWISERKDVLSGLFFLLALEAWRRWVARPGPARYALVLAATVLGLMSKPMLVTLPFVLLLIDVWPLGRLAGFARAAGPVARASAARPTRTFAALILEKWPLFVLSALASIITFLVQEQAGAMSSMGAIAPATRVSNALLSCWRYIGKLFWPESLAPFYPYDHGAHRVGVAAAAAGLALVTVLALSQARRRPYFAFGWLWYLGMLLPVIGLVQVGGQSYADRYTYLPTIGLTIALVWGLGDLGARSRRTQFALAGAALIALAGLAGATARQVARWKDTRTLFSHTLAVTRENPIAHQCLGDVLLKEGNVALALPHYEEAVRLAPDFADAHNKLGSALGVLARYDEAVAQFQLALQLAASAEIRHNLGFAYEKLGRTDDAIREYETALTLDPDHLLSLVHLGAALTASGGLTESEAHLRHALELAPQGAEVRRMLAVTLTLEGRVEEAIGAYEEILLESPDDLDALNNVAWIRATHAEAGHRNGAEAVRLAERARDASPQPVAVLYSTLAAAYAEAGRYADAVAAGERALELARAAHEPQEAERFAHQLELYRAGKPFHFER